MKQEKWSELRKSFEDYFGEEAETSEEELIHDSGSSKFIISKDETVSASMPLHSFISEEFQEIYFRDDHIRVLCENVIYEFRK